MVSTDGSTTHELVRDLQNGRLYACTSLKEDATILDVGTGDGQWAIDVAKAMPRARVCGIDVRQVTAAPSSPSNVIFETVNVMEGFPFNTGTFDLVHSRLLCGGITDWRQYLSNLWRITRKGGSVECIEVELALLGQSAGRTLSDCVARWNALVPDYLNNLGLDSHCAQSLDSRLRELPFEEVKHEAIEVQLSTDSLALTFLKDVIDWLESDTPVEGCRDSLEIRNVRQAAHDLRACLGSAADVLSMKWHFCSATK
ncbi:hypothetical protein PYCC9005_000875 [Savitreella phatthalungensis]